MKAVELAQVLHPGIKSLWVHGFLDIKQHFGEFSSGRFTNPGGCFWEREKGGEGVTGKICRQPKPSVVMSESV